MNGFGLSGMQDILNLPLFTWLADLWNAIATILPNSVDFINELIARIEAVEFNTSFAAVTHFLGVIRYLIGDVNYLLIIGSIYIGTGFIFYRLINKLIGLLQQIFKNMNLNHYVKIFKP